MRLCTVEDCGRKYRRNGFCGMHSERVRAHGDPHRAGKTLTGRILSKILKLDNGCWQWTASTDGGGYGLLITKGADGKRTHTVAHRAAYEEFRGPIPAGLQLDHLCRNRACVNPDHLEPVTSRENTLRGETVTARNLAKTHCKHGHPLSGSNVYHWRTSRICRACRRNTQRRRGRNL